MIQKSVPSKGNYKKIAHTIFQQISHIDKAVIFLNGPMGAGKTTFAQTLVEFYGCNKIQSSSFAIVTTIPGTRNIIHCDFYRYFPNEEFWDCEILPLLGNQYLLLIEWGHPNAFLHDASHFCFNITAMTDGSRSVRFTEIITD